MKKVIIYIILSVFITGIYAQKYNLSQFSLDKGLSQSQVFASTQAPDGSMWIGTLGGAITIYNGMETNYITTEEALPDYSIWKLFTANDGKIWIGTASGIAYYDGYKIINFDNKVENVRDITEDAYNNIWFSSDTAIFIIKNDKIELVETFAYSTPAVFCDSKNNIWYFSSEGVDKITDNKINTVIKKEYLQGTIIFEDNSNNMWFGTDAGLYFYDNKNIKCYTEEDGLASNRIVDIIQDNKSNIWVATEENGLSIFDGQNFLNISTSEGLGIGYTPDLYRDKHNNIWIGTDGDGAYMFKNFRFKQLDFDTIAANNFIMSILIEENGVKWFGTDGAGIVVEKNGNYESLSTDNGLVSNFIYDIIKDKKGNYWFASYEGLSKYDGAKFTNYTNATNNSFTTDYTMSLLDDDMSNIWVGTNGGGLYKITDNKVINYDYSNSFEANTVWDIYQSKKGDIYFGTDNGLIVFSGKDTIHYTEKDGLNELGIGTIIEDNQGVIWLGTDKGISRFDGKNFINYTKKDGLSSDICYFIHFDKNNYIISGTEKGIDKIKFDKKGQLISLKHYGKNDGFFGIECNLNAVSEDKNGILYIGTIDGVTIYNPILEQDTIFEAITNITKIKLFYEDIDWLQYTDSILSWSHLPYNLILPYNKNNLTFEFIGIDYKNPEKVSYKFMLQGFDDNWMPITDARYATYSNIPPGKYTFKVKALTSEGIWNEESSKFYFEIRKPFWKTILFYIIVGISLILSIVSIIYFRTRRLQKAKIELQNKVMERTAEIMQQKEEIEAQRDEIEAQRDVVTAHRNEIEEKRRKTTDSIIYAKRIQKALFPQNKLFEENFSEYFIFFKPRDIVSGDFYWIKKVNNHILFAVADCTGHGVPGAFMSLLGISFLNEIVMRSEITQTSEVLEELRRRIKNTLKQGDSSNSKDGIDMALCCIDKDTNILQYSGANNPLYVISADKKLSVYKADRQPVGIYVKERNFKQTDIQLQKNDLIYLFSDGITDQFGGERDMKFMTKRLKKLLLDNSHKNMSEQNKVIETTFENWKKENNQLDDVLLIGAKIESTPRSVFLPKSRRIQILETEFTCCK